MGNPKSDLHYLEAPQLPQYVAQFASYLMTAFREQAGSLDTSQLTKKKQVPSPDTIEKFTDALGIPLKLESRYIEKFLCDAGAIAVPVIIQFFTTRQRMRLLGPHGAMIQDFNIDPDNMIPAGMRREEFHKYLSIYIQQGSLNGTTRERAKQEALVLLKLGVISRQEVLRRFEYGNIGKILAEIKEEQGMAQAGKALTQLMGGAGGRAPRTQGAKKSGAAA
jgi:hypothetical protein